MLPKTLFTRIIPTGTPSERFIVWLCCRCSLRTVKFEQISLFGSKVLQVSSLPKARVTIFTRRFVLFVTKIPPPQKKRMCVPDFSCLWTFWRISPNASEIAWKYVHLFLHAFQSTHYRPAMPFWDRHLFQRVFPVQYCHSSKNITHLETWNVIILAFPKSQNNVF